MERYRWEFCGHILVILHIGLLCISSSSWTHTILSGKRGLLIFEGDSGKEAKLASWFRQFKCLSLRDALLLPSAPIPPAVQVIICLEICLVKDDKELDADGVTGTYSFL